MKTKQDFETWYSKENPWDFNGTYIDRVRRKILAHHLKGVDSSAVKSVLDAGCGEGYVARDLAEKFGAPVDAFDISDKAVEIAKKRNGLPNIHFYQLDLNDFQPQKEYDLIVCEEALYYLNDDERKRALEKFYQSLRKGGFLKISVVSIGENQYRKYFTIDSILDLVTATGFEVRSVKPSVVNVPGLVNRVLFKLFKIAYDKTHLSFIETLQMRSTLLEPLKNCYQISILCRKV